MAPDDSKPDDSDDPVAELLPEDPPQAEAELRPDDPAANLGPDPPRIPDASESDADPELKRRFWSLVLVFNVALFGMSLGLMLVGFEGRWRVGGAIFAVGAFAFLRGWRGYRTVQREVESDDEDGEAAESDEFESEDENGEETDDSNGSADPDESDNSELQKD